MTAVSIGATEVDGGVTARTAPQAGVLRADQTWRVWVTRHPIGGALLSGFMATHIATVFGIWFPAIGLPALDWPIANGFVIDPKGSIPVQFALGEFIHGIDGLVFSLIFAIFLFPLFKLRNSAVGNLAKALIFSMVLATISAGFLVPYVYYPHFGAGVFTTGFGWKTVFAIYLWHVVYGVNLGTMYNPLPLDDPLLVR
jgi:hypothetical protein